MDTFEQRLIADLTDAAEAAVDQGLTPPDRAAVAASVARRQRRRRVQVLAAVAAVVVALAGLAAVLTGGAGLDRTEMQPPATQPTAPPATSRPAPTPTTPDDSTPTTPDTSTDVTATEPGSSPDTTPNDPEAPGDVPNPLPVTADEMLAVGANFDALPPTCRNFWDTVGATPEEYGLDSSGNLLELDPSGVTIADVNGDGVDDGIATYICETTGTIPPDGVVVMLAVRGEVESERRALFDRNELSAEHMAQFGDGRTRFTGAPTVVTTPEGETLIEVSLLSYREPDPNCCASARAVAQFGMAGDALQLVNLNQA